MEIILVFHDNFNVIFCTFDYGCLSCFHKSIQFVCSCDALSSLLNYFVAALYVFPVPLSVFEGLHVAA